VRPHLTLGLGLFEIYRDPPRAEVAEAWTITERLLAEMRTLAGGRLAVVLVPAPWEVDGGVWDAMAARHVGLRDARLDPEAPARRLRRFLAAERIPHLDLLPVFRRAGAAAPRYFAGDHHWTAEGHRLAAAAVTPWAAALVMRNQP
jgi:hypothetical protein